MLDKPLDQITVEDIAELRERGVYESEVLEFKSDLPGDGGRPNAWNAGGGISQTARDGLLREIVAFANAQGGTLILGITETREKPARAERITPVGRVHDLADRLQEAARVCIEPPLGALQVRGIATRGETEGVVLLRTAASLAGPHRIASEGHAFIRRGPSSVKMTIREIQDLTLDLARGADRLEALFANRMSLFTEWLETSPTEVGAYRITGVPLGRFAGLPRMLPDGRNPIVSGRSRHRVLIGDAQIECEAPPHGAMRPIIRGLRFYSQDNSTQLEVYQTGLVDMWSRTELTNGMHLHLNWILGSYLLVLDYLQSIRTASNSPDFEFGLELSLAGHTNVAQYGGGTRPLSQLVIGLPDNMHKWQLKPPITFPRAPSRAPSDHAALINLVLRDLADAAGDGLPWPELRLPA